jgi:hypothetical protein
LFAASEDFGRLLDLASSGLPTLPGASGQEANERARTAALLLQRLGWRPQTASDWRLGRNGNFDQLADELFEGLDEVTLRAPELDESIGNTVQALQALRLDLPPAPRRRWKPSALVDFLRSDALLACFDAQERPVVGEAFRYTWDLELSRVGWLVARPTFSWRLKRSARIEEELIRRAVQILDGMRTLTGAGLALKAASKSGDAELQRKRRRQFWLAFTLVRSALHRARLRMEELAG